MEQSFYSIEDVADLLKLHAVTVRNKARKSSKGWLKIGTHWRISKSDFELWINELKAERYKRKKPQ